MNPDVDLATEPVAVNAWIRPTGGQMVMVNDGQLCVGAASYRITDDGVKIINLGVTQKRKGYGTKLIKSIEHATGRTDLWCHAVPEAVPFYQAVGFHIVDCLHDGRMKMKRL